MSSTDRPPRLVWTAAETAHAMGLSLQRFYERVKTLQREHGFPRPLHGLRNYDPVAVRDWIAAQRPPSDGVPGADRPLDLVLIERAHAMLDATDSAGG